MAIDDITCKKCGSPVRHSLAHKVRGWICINDLCLWSRFIERDQSENEMWEEIHPIAQLHFPGETLTGDLLKKVHVKLTEIELDSHVRLHKGRSDND